MMMHPAVRHADQSERARLEQCGPNVQRGNPFWVVHVAPNALYQHNGFFNPYFLVFARAVVLGSLD